MLVQMRVAQTLQHAGTERPLSPGEVYEVSDVVGRELLDHGFATRAEMRAPETKAVRPEKSGRR